MRLWAVWLFLSLPICVVHCFKSFRLLPKKLHGLITSSSSERITSSTLLAANRDGDDQESDNASPSDKLSSSFQGAFITEGRPSFEEFKRMQREISEASGGSAGRAVEYNWRYGLCKHLITFEGSDKDTIRRFKFLGDLMAFGTLSGHVTLIRMSTGKVLDHYHSHDCEVTSIDFDGINLVTGAANGKVACYELTYGQEQGGEGEGEGEGRDLSSPPATTAANNGMGRTKAEYDSLHSRSVTSLQLVRLPSTTTTTTSSGGSKGYVFCYAIVLPSFLDCDYCLCLSLTHLWPPACIL